jgi:phosphoribosylformylglycinamidine synthase
LTGLGDILPVLFNEELGAVIQVRHSDVEDALAVLRENDLAYYSHVIGTITDDQQIGITINGTKVIDSPRSRLQRYWAETSYQMQAQRDNPACAEEEFDTLLDNADPGLSADLTFDPTEHVAASFIVSGIRPKVAILREQGVNGQIEMAAAFDSAGFTAVDVHMSDILAGRIDLDDFKGLVACGGFSYGDVLGAGRGWASTILHNNTARQQFSNFFNRQDTFVLGVCNGCQMLSQLKELIPGSDHWPQFERNISEQFEARFSLVEIVESPSILLKGMAGSTMPIAVAHGEGRAEFASTNDVDNA